MGYFVAYRPPGSEVEWKAVNGAIHPLRKDASMDAMGRNFHQYGDFKVFDADHEPGKSILAKRNPFS